MLAAISQLSKNYLQFFLPVVNSSEKFRIIGSTSIKNNGNFSFFY